MRDATGICADLSDLKSAAGGLVLGLAFTFLGAAVASSLLGRYAGYMKLLDYSILLDLKPKPQGGFVQGATRPECRVPRSAAHERLAVPVLRYLALLNTCPGHDTCVPSHSHASKPFW